MCCDVMNLLVISKSALGEALCGVVSKHQWNCYLGISSVCKLAMLLQPGTIKFSRQSLCPCRDSQGSRVRRGSRLINAIQIERRIPEKRPTRLIFRLLSIHPQGLSQNPDFVLQATNDLQLFAPLIRPQSVSCSKHLANFEGLSMPVITVESGL